jgi:hypothetical protein
MDPGISGGQPATHRRQVTVLESVEDIRAQLRGSASRTLAETPAVPRQGQAKETQPFRPTVRPPIGLLHVFDDGEETGEDVRVRVGSFVIGRVEGDLVIPHDAGISGRHAEILRRVENGAAAWLLRDLNSTNGTFVRAATVALHHDQELLIGGRIFRFASPAQGPDAAEAANAEAIVTRKWEGMSRGGIARASSTPPALVEVAAGSVARSYALTGGEVWLGRDPRRCSIVVDDPTVDPRHARVYRDERGRWVIANERSRNGLWARVREVSLGRGGYFQCGEQRFFFKAL